MAALCCEPSVLVQLPAVVNIARLDVKQQTITLRVRYDECDPGGFVHHSNYLTYFEIGRTEFFRSSGGRYRDIEAAGWYVVVARVDCRYKLPARYDDEIQLTTRIVDVTAAKIVHEYEIHRDNTLLVQATVTLAVIDRDGRLQRVPDALIQ
ncbi:Acyl-CoA thioester hydrolase YbgC [Allorhodopirellula heiligendammensis]|uniref:Acyl-CoA thioester hydrolase YbgC n=1 Tax=Allorhodopirellula heiligendammensis TaxID=2714739 RepID=A0A5C6BW25_9BACT|nr:Acyl-CoA thioester hydrolase YbgC [Allorhodopirellula heiligendammensis]